MNRLNQTAVALALAVGVAAGAQANTFTSTSPTSGALPAGVSTIGGVVLDLYGTNGAHVVSQLSASSLYQGFANDNPFIIGVQSGFNASVVNSLGGGLASMAVRFTLYDGDSAAGDFDRGADLRLLVNGVNLGNWSAVTTQTTDAQGNGNGIGSTHLGFADEKLDTGWFFTSNASILNSFYGTLSGGSVTYSVYDADPYDNYYDFKQGLNASLLNVGSAPVVTSAVPEPQTYMLMLAGLAVMGASARRRKLPG